MASRSKYPGSTETPGVSALDESVSHPAAPIAAIPVATGAPIEALGLPVRTRNALRGVGCHTVADILHLDLSLAIRGLGSKSKEQLLTQLSQAGLHHPAMDNRTVSDAETLDRSLERIEARITAAMSSITKEIRLVKQKLRKRIGSEEEKPPLTAPEAGRRRRASRQRS